MSTTHDANLSLMQKLHSDGFVISTEKSHQRALLKNGTLFIRDTRMSYKRRYDGKEQFVVYSFNSRTGFVRRIVPWNYNTTHPLNPANKRTPRQYKSYNNADQVFYSWNGYNTQDDKGKSTFELIEKYYHLMLHFRTGYAKQFYKESK